MDLPTQAVPLEQAGMGKMKMALVGVGDGLPAAEISTRALRNTRSSHQGFNKVNEFGQSIDANPQGTHHEAEFEDDDGIKELVAGEPEPEPAIEPKSQAPKPVAKKAAKKVARVQAPPAEEDDEPEGMSVIGKISYKANHMEMKIQVLGIKFEAPALAIMVPMESDNTFEPPAKAEGVQVKFPKELQQYVPEGIPVDTWIDIYVTGIYFDIEEFGIRLSMFYANP